jgi:hypothetical protein
MCILASFLLGGCPHAGCCDSFSYCIPLLLHFCLWFGVFSRWLIGLQTITVGSVVIIFQQKRNDPPQGSRRHLSGSYLKTEQDYVASESQGPA